MNDFVGNILQNKFYACCYIRGVKHKARGPNPARCVVGSGPRDDFVTKKLVCLLEKSIQLYFNNWRL